MATPSQNFTPRLYHGVGPPLPAGRALAVYGLATATFFAITLVIGNSPLASALTQVLAFVAVPLAALRLHGASPRDLGIERPPLLPVVGALVIGCGLWLISLHIAVPILEATEREDQTRELSRRLLAPDVALPLVIAANALVPGVCEELAHRGLLLGALAPRLGRAGGVAVTTALFALLHLQPARMASSGLLGLIAAVLAIWARSVWPAVTLHVVNNTVALCLGAGLAPDLARLIGAHPDGSLTAAAALVTTGLGIAWIGRQPT